MTYIRRAEAAAESPERRPDAKSTGERNRSTLGKVVYAWSTAAKRRKLKAAGVRAAWSLERYFTMDGSFDTYVATGRACAFPSVERLAADIGATRRTAQRALRELEAADLIERSATPGGRKHTNEYWLVPQQQAGDGANRAPGRAVSRAETARTSGQETARTSGPKTAPPVTARIHPTKGVKNTRAAMRGAAPYRDGGAPRRRNGGGGGSDRGSIRDPDLDDYLAAAGSLPMEVGDDEDGKVIERVIFDDAPTERRPRPERTRESRDKYEAYRAGLDPDDEHPDRYEWLCNQLGGLSATEAAALIEDHRPRLDRRDYVSLINLIRRRK